MTWLGNATSALRLASCLAGVLGLTLPVAARASCYERLDVQLLLPSCDVADAWPSHLPPRMRVEALLCCDAGGVQGSCSPGSGAVPETIELRSAATGATVILRTLGGGEVEGTVLGLASPLPAGRYSWSQGLVEITEQPGVAAEGRCELPFEPVGGETPGRDAPPAPSGPARLWLELGLGVQAGATVSPAESHVGWSGVGLRASLGIRGWNFHDAGGGGGPLPIDAGAILAHIVGFFIGDSYGLEVGGDVLVDPSGRFRASGTVAWRSFIRVGRVRVPSILGALAPEVGILSDPSGPTWSLRFAPRVAFPMDARVAVELGLFARFVGRLGDGGRPPASIGVEITVLTFPG
jgi:hypothetical protein